MKNPFCCIFEKSFPYKDVGAKIQIIRGKMKQADLSKTLGVCKNTVNIFHRAPFLKN